MGEFELTGRLAFGTYLPGGSPVHRLDPRFKLVVGLLVIVSLFVSPSLAGLLAGGLALVAGTIVAGAPLTYAWRSLRAVLPLTLLVLALQLFTVNPAGCRVFWSGLGIYITSCSGHVAIASLLRLADMVLLLTLITLTTSVTDVTRGVESLLRPLASVGLPAHELALVLAIALRFVPLLAEETERLTRAQAARGADFGAGSRNLMERVRRLLPLLVPLFVSGLRRAEDMAVAMDARAYSGGRGRTNLIRLEAARADWTALAVGMAVAAAIIAIPGP